MRLIEDWKWVIKKAYSAWLMLLAGFLSALELVLPFFTHDYPRSVFVPAIMVVTFSAYVTRFIAQRPRDDSQK